MTEIRLPAVLYLVRHGQTYANVQKIIDGHLDSTLTEEGQAQARQLAQLLKGVHFDAVFSSDLIRAKHTAEIIAFERKLLVNTTALLRERNFGTHEGKAEQIFREENKEIYEKIKGLPLKERWEMRFGSESESTGEMFNRFLNFIRELAVTYSGQTILVVTHGGLLQSLLVHLGWATFDELPMRGIQNTAYIKLSTDGVDFQIQELNGIKKVSI